jgi:hypothetical protein
MVFHYLDDLDSKLASARVALASPSGDDEWSAYSSALGRKFLKLDEFLKPAPPVVESGSQAPAEPKPQVQKPAAAPANIEEPAKPKQESPSFLRKLFS